MKKRKVWITVGVSIAIVLLLWWLYASTLLTEDENESVQDPFGVVD